MHMIDKMHLINGSSLLFGFFHLHCLSSLAFPLGDEDLYLKVIFNHFFKKILAFYLFFSRSLFIFSHTVLYTSLQL